MPAKKRSKRSLEENAKGLIQISNIIISGAFLALFITPLPKMLTTPLPDLSKSLLDSTLGICMVWWGLALILGSFLRVKALDILDDLEESKKDDALSSTDRTPQ